MPNKNIYQDKNPIHQSFPSIPEDELENTNSSKMEQANLEDTPDRKKAEEKEKSKALEPDGHSQLRKEDEKSSSAKAAHKENRVEREREGENPSGTIKERAEKSYDE